MEISLEERFALQDLMTAYCYAIDDLSDINDLLDLFTEDAVLDFSDIGLRAMHGKPAFREFYENVFRDMSHHTHYLTNFRVERFDGDTATTFAYAQGLGLAKDGVETHVHVRYRMECVKTDFGWRCSRYEILTGMPMPPALEEMHGDH